MQGPELQLDAVRRKIDSLRADNARLRLELNLEISRLVKLQDRGGERNELSADLRERIEELTPREIQVLRCIAEGLSTKEAGARLGIAFKTAACHRHRIMQKLDVHGTGWLVRIAIASGLVSI